MTELFFTADQHYGHNNIIKYCNRPFLSEKDQEALAQMGGDWSEDDPDNPWAITQEAVKEMDETLIQRHNEIVGLKDHVYILGDFSFRGAKDPKQYFNRLNGRKFLIKGNHDKKEVLRLPWSGVFDVHFLRIKQVPGMGHDRTELFLSHYPHLAWNKSGHGIGHLFGHMHGTCESQRVSFDVGVDAHDFRPINFYKVKEELERRREKHWVKRER